MVKKDKQQVIEEKIEKQTKISSNQLKQKTLLKEIPNEKNKKKIKHVKCRRCLTGMNYNLTDNLLALITCTNKKKIAGKLCIMSQCVHHKLCMYFNSKKMNKILRGNPPWKCPICFKKALNYFEV